MADISVIDTLKATNSNGDAVVVYPRTKTKAITDENGNLLNSMALPQGYTGNIDELFTPGFYSLYGNPDIPVTGSPQASLIVFGNDATNNNIGQVLIDFNTGNSSQC